MPNRAALISALAVLGPAILVLVAIAILARPSASAPATGSIGALQIDASQPAGSKPAPTPRPSGPLAPDFEGSGAWINSGPLKLADLTGKGKVVLVDFWTYGCYNCQ